MASLSDIAGSAETVLKLINYINTVRHAEEERSELYREIKSLLGYFKKVQSTWCNFNPDQKDEVQEILNQVKLCISKLERRLKRSPHHFKNISMRLLWFNQKEDILESIEKIYRFNSQLSNLITNKIAVDVHGLSAAEHERAVNNLINLFTPPISDGISKEPARVRYVTKGTGTWFYEEDEFISWEESEKSVLWLNGWQGCGKTGLAVITAKEMKERAGNPPTYQVARVFCDYLTSGLQELQDHMDIIMSLWVQLVNSLPDPKFELKYVQGALSKRAAAYSYDEGRKQKMAIFKNTIAKLGGVVLILDGLDEIPRDLQGDVVKSLREIQQSSNKCRLLITSRPYESIKEMFRNDPDLSKFHLEAKEFDLKLYFRECMERKGWSDDGVRAKSIEDTIEMLIPKCKGSFLMGHLSMKEVLKAKTREECLKIIEELPEEAADAYDRGLNRLALENSGPRLKNGLPCLAIQALFWVTYVKSPMTAQQLRQALAIDQDDVDYNPRKELWEETTIDTLCGELVAVDPRNDEVFVAHKSFIEHLTLDETRERWFSNIREHIPYILLHFLQFDILKRPVGIEVSDEEFKNRFPLCSYALDHWGAGLAQILKRDTALWDMTEGFLKEESHRWNDKIQDQAVMLLTSKCHDKMEFFPMPRQAAAPGQITGQHWAVLFDLQDFIPILSKHERNSPITDAIPTTPLGLAAAYNRGIGEKIARQLLENGADVNKVGDAARGLGVRPPLYDAIFYCHEEVVELLLKNGADKTLRRIDNDESPLDLAYVLGRYKVAKILASHISGDVPTTAQELQFLIRGGFAAQLRRAIGEGLNVNHPCENGKMALDYARDMENKEITNILIENQAVSKLTWPAIKTESCDYPVNFFGLSTHPLISEERWWGKSDHVTVRNGDHPPFTLLLDVPVHTDVKLPIRSIVFETASRDQGWSSWPDEHGTYLSSSTIQVSLKQRAKKSNSFVVQHNLHAHEEFKLHTNIWNLSELRASSPRRAELIESIRHGSVLQLSAHVGGGPGWETQVSFVRVRMYGVEVDETNKRKCP